MYVLILLVVLLLILLTWGSVENALKGMLVFVIGYYVGKYFSSGFENYHQMRELVRDGSPL